MARLLPKTEGNSQGCVKIQKMMKGQTQRENTELPLPFTTALILLGSPVTGSPLTVLGNAISSCLL